VLTEYMVRICLYWTYRGIGDVSVFFNKGILFHKE
jgi:hypothetical protein